MNLTHIYQAWIQGQNTNSIDWQSFANFVARNTDSTAEFIMSELPKYSWYKA